MDWLGELFRFGPAAEVAVIDSSTPTVATDEQTTACLVRCTGGTYAFQRFVRFQPRKAGAWWIVRNELGSSIAVGGPSGATVPLAAGAVRAMVWDGANMVLIGVEYPPLAEASGPPGLVTIPDNTDTFLRGDGTWVWPRPVVSVEAGTAPAAFPALPFQARTSRTGGAVAVTFTLPASPVAGDVFEAINADIPNHTLTLARNGKKINGGTSDLVMATSLGHQRLVYIDATTGWWSAGKQ